MGYLADQSIAEWNASPSSVYIDLAYAALDSSCEKIVVVITTRQYDGSTTPDLVAGTFDYGGNDESMTLVSGALAYETTGGDRHMGSETWYLDAPTDLTSGTIRFEMVAQPGTYEVVVTIYEYDSEADSGASGGVVAVSATSTAATGTVATDDDDNSAVAGFHAQVSDAGPCTPQGVTTTEDYDASPSIGWGWAGHGTTTGGTDTFGATTSVGRRFGLTGYEVMITAAAGDFAAVVPVKTLTEATFAPTVALGPLNVTPPVKTLTAATFAPTVVVSDHQSIEVPVQTGPTLATFAPTIALGPLDVTPPTKTLTEATFAPTVALGPLSIEVPVQTGPTIATFAPDVGISQVIEVPVKTLSEATFAPTVALGPLAVEVPVKTLSEATFAPSIALGPLDVTPAQVDLTVATFAPTVDISADRVIVVPVATLTQATFAPTVDNPVAIEVPATSLAYSTFAPTVDNPWTVTVPVQDMSVSTYVPVVDVTVGGNIAIEVPATPLAYTTYVPTVTVPAITKDGGDYTVKPTGPRERPKIMDPVIRVDPMFEMRQRQKADMQANELIREENQKVENEVTKAVIGYDFRQQKASEGKDAVARQFVADNKRQEIARAKEEARQRKINDARNKNLKKARKAKAKKRGKSK